MKTSICTWSLRNDLTRVTNVMRLTGVNGLHLDVSAVEIFKPAINANHWTISSMMVAFPQEDYSTLESIKATGGILPNDSWPENRTLALQAIQTTAAMKVPYLSTHVGFIDHTDQSAYPVICGRLRELADSAASENVVLLLETGQETAEDLKSFLMELDHPAVGINLDPANMILYGKGDPIEAIRILGPWIKHVHIKDAIASPVAGEWGREVPWGEGQVDTAGFFEALEKIGFDGNLAIEREAGEQREMDITLAVERLKSNV